MEQKRQLTLQATREKEEMGKETLRKKFEDDARFVEQLGTERSKELALAKERENLNKQLKLENVERIKRIQEYKRLETLRKISEGDQRTQDMLKRKEEIVEQRRMAGLKTKMQKDEIMSVLESSRANGGRAIQMLQDVLLNDTSKGGKKKTKKGKTVERSSSAGNDETFNPSESLGPPPDAPSLKARMAKTDNAGAMPYKSPYEGGEEYMGNETVTF